MLSKIKIKIGSVLSYKKLILKTDKPGLLKFKARASVKATSYGKITYLSSDKYHGESKTLNLEFSKGDTLQSLQPRAEGEYFVLKDNIVYSIDLNNFNWDKVAKAEGVSRDKTYPFQIVKKPSVKAWIYVEIAKDKKGWLLVGKDVKEYKRSY